MAKKTANATINGQEWTLGTFTTMTYDEGLGYAGTSDGYQYACAIKFTMPKFVGKSTNIAIKVCFEQVDGGVDRSSIRWALCNSDANASDYCGTRGYVSDSYQIANGDFDVNYLYYESPYAYTITVSTSALKSNTPYYLFLWGDNNNYTGVFHVSTYSHHTVTLTYDGGGVVFIDNGSGFEEYEIYIDNGTSWEQYEAYVDNGSSWDMISL